MRSFLLSSPSCAWRKLFVLVFLFFPQLSISQDFTIVALPDTQRYAASYPSTFFAQTRWIADNVYNLNIKAVIGLGDVVNGGGESSQWQTASNAYSVLDGKVPYFVAMGNHDYNSDDPQHRTASASNLNKYFGPSRYAYAGSGYGASFTPGSNESFWASLVIDNKSYLFLFLEFYPRFPVLQWASTVIRDHPSTEVFLVTHAYGDNDNTRLTLCDQYNAEHYNLGADNDGDEVWTNLASQYPNITLVLSGHIISSSPPSEAHMTEPGLHGNTVNEMMSDFENLPNGGNGYLRLLTFRPATNQIVVSTYSPTLKNYLTDTKSSFTIPWHTAATTKHTGTIKGVLKTSSCAPVSGATVSYSLGSTTTDSAGKYTLSSVPPGTWTVSANASGYPVSFPAAPAGFHNRRP